MAQASFLLSGVVALVLGTGFSATAAEKQMTASVNYARPFEPPTHPAFIPLPPGAVEPLGWLRDWCLAAKDGYTGHMDEVDDEFKRAWAADHKMTGESLMWYKGAWPYEGGGYWFDGLVRLGYALHDEALIQQAKKRLYAVADNTSTNGLLFLWWLDKNKPEDRKAVRAALDGWPLWACGLLGRGMTGYYAGSGDTHILDALENAYGGDPDGLRWIPGNLSNIWPAYDTYAWTGNKAIGASLNAMFKEEGAGLLPNVNRYRKAPELKPGTTVTNAHVVEFVECTTPWAVGYLWTGNTNYLQAAVGWHDLIERVAMQPYGVPVSDEWYVPSGAFRGSETCDVANYIWSQTALLAVTGEGRMADRAERAFFNAGPATVSRDFKTHIYFQSPNRVANGSPDFPHGPRAGGGSYKTKHSPLCCTAALNRIVPYYVTHMWMATYDNGLAATCYGPCKVTALVADRVPVEIVCKTDYPFNEVIELSVKPAKKATFPLFFHIPGWCEKPELSVNGSAIKVAQNAKGFACVSRRWKSGDTVRLRFPMTAVVTTGRDNAPGTPYTGAHKPTLVTIPESDSARGLPYAAVSYGPLLFARAIPDTQDANTPDPDARWNFALDVQHPDITVERLPMPAQWNWPRSSPLKLRANAVAINWNPAYDSPKLPDLPVVPQNPSEKITLIPYGCTKFRISMFPVTAGADAKATRVAKASPNATPVPFVQNRLKDTLETAVPACRGWGKRETPCVYANSGTGTASFLSGAISIPPRSVAVHPGAYLDVAVGWQSPVSGKVKVRAKVTHAHPAGGDGVTWAIIHAGQAGRKMLAQGVVERAGVQAIPAAADVDKLAAVAVEKGDGVFLLIGPREHHNCDSTVVELVITDTQDNSRVWDLTKDVVADIQAANPHADSLGNAAVWHFFAPGKNRLLSKDDALLSPRPALGPRVKAWTLATDDTKLTVGATATGQVCVYELSNPVDRWNWTAEPSVFALLSQAEVGSAVQTLSWTFKEGAMDKADGQKLTLRFVCADPLLELCSEWRARPGRGPVHHVIRITNRSDTPVTLLEQPTLHLDLVGPADNGIPVMWTFHSDGGTPDKTGVYRDTMEPPFYRQVRTHPNGEFIPYAVFDSGGKHGVYVGLEWSYCRIAAASVEDQKTGSLRVRGGEFAGFRVSVKPDETFETPPGFVGAYRGDLDDAGNSLRRHLFKYDMPEVVRRDTTYPKVQWNAHVATGEKWGSWNCVESKYYPLVDTIAPLGFEEVMIDVGWWKGATCAPEPESDPVDWPSGMAKAAEYAHKAGLRFGLYWNKGEEMAAPEGRARRVAHVKRLYSEHKADMWRSDSTGGPVVSASYASVKGFYAMLDQLSREIPCFQWENCCSGGRVKDFGAMKYAVKIFNSDTYTELDNRQSFYDTSYMFPPAQIEAHNCNRDHPLMGSPVFAFRSCSLGAPLWCTENPNGGNGGKLWSAEEKETFKAAVATYKTKIRPLVRSADLYHILPRPDGKSWDGIQYYDPIAKKGVAYLFKTVAGTDTLTIRLRGVKPRTTYRVTFEDNTNPAVEKTGEELAKGIEVTLKGAPVSELLFLEARE